MNDTLGSSTVKIANRCSISQARAQRVALELFCESVGAFYSATFALGVLEEQRLLLGLVLELRGGGIQNINSFDALTLDAPLTLSPESFERLWQAFATSRPAAALLCSRGTIEELASQDRKLSYLAAAGPAQEYFYRVELT
jgi:hypothetical protein